MVAMPLTPSLRVQWTLAPCCRSLKQWELPPSQLFQRWQS
jgi:hypothetical protein